MSVHIHVHMYSTYTSIMIVSVQVPDQRFEEDHHNSDEVCRVDNVELLEVLPVPEDEGGREGGREGGKKYIQYM